LSDDAPTSLASHHQALGDLDVKATQWENTDGFAKKRFIKYDHPINIPLSIAPPAGSATKTQIMRRFGDNGICIDTETWISDVPLADCFYVADRLLVASNPEGGISLTIQFGNCFVKRTMFKGIIAATSVSDVTTFHKAFVTLIVGTLPDASTRPIVAPQLVEGVHTDIIATKETPKSHSRFGMSLCLVFVFLFMLGDHFYLVNKLNATNEKLTRLEILVEGKLQVHVCEN